MSTYISALIGLISRPEKAAFSVSGKQGLGFLNLVLKQLQTEEQLDHVNPV